MKTLRFILALLFTANGLWMLSAPLQWFGTVPGVSETGAFNPHFVRDIGAAYLLCGLAFGALVWWPVAARPYALAACAFLLAHAGIHLLETLTGVQGIRHLLRDLPAVLILPLVATWVAWR